MILIFFEGSRIPANDNGTPIAPPQYWLDDPAQTVMNGIAAAYAAGEWEPVPEPPPAPPEPDWTGFNLAMRNDFAFQSWFSFLPPIDQQAIVATSVNSNAPALQSAMAVASQGIPYPQEAAATWAGIATQYGIPLSF